MKSQSNNQILVKLFETMVKDQFLGNYEKYRTTWEDVQNQINSQLHDQYEHIAGQDILSLCTA